jgi:hypothetical protein
MKSSGVLNHTKWETATDALEAIRFSETTVPIYQARRRNMSNNLNTHFYRCENLKCHT